MFFVELVHLVTRNVVLSSAALDVRCPSGFGGEVGATNKASERGEENIGEVVGRS